MSDGKKSRIEAEIQRRFRDMYDEYLKDQGEQIPEPDLSFLQEEKPKKRKEHRVLRRFATITACMVLLLVTSSGMAIWISSDAAHAVKFSLEKTLHRISGTFFSTDDGKEIETEENQISITIDSMDDIQDAINFMPDLPVPGYIPEGFELETLKIIKFMTGDFTATYNFNYDSDISFVLTSSSIVDDEATAGLTYEIEEFTIGKYEAYYWSDAYTSTHGVSILMEDQLVDVTGNIDQNIMRRIAENVYVQA